MSTTEEPGASPIEEIYDRNIAAEKLKHGTKYEQLTAIVFQALDADATVTHDVRLRGDGKTTPHQIDVHVARGDQSRRVIIECRDKEDPNKIGLDEARSFATVVRHLNADGIMVTTTDYTQGAKQLAQDEGLQLLTLRPFTEADIEGRIMRIEIRGRAVIPIPKRVVITPADETETREGQTVTVRADAPILSGSDESNFGAVLQRMMDVPLDAVPEGTQTAVSGFEPPLVVAVDDDHQFPIAAVRVDYNVATEELGAVIDAGKKVAELVLRSLDDTFDKVIWDSDLQRFKIDPVSKRVIERGNEPS